MLTKIGKGRAVTRRSRSASQLPLGPGAGIFQIGPTAGIAQYLSLGTNGVTYANNMINEYTNWWWGAQGSTSHVAIQGNDGYNYYDRASIYYALSRMVSTSTWESRAQSLVLDYIQWYIDTAATQSDKWTVNQNTEWMQHNGVLEYYYRTGSANAKEWIARQGSYTCQLYSMPDSGVIKYGDGLWGNTAVDGYTGYDERVNARNLRSLLMCYLINAQNIANGDIIAPLRASWTTWKARLDQILDAILAAIGRSPSPSGGFFAWVNDYPPAADNPPGTATNIHRHKPWMLCMIANALIDVWLSYPELSSARRTSIETKVKQMCDLLWPFFITATLGAGHPTYNLNTKCFPYLTISGSATDATQTERDNYEGNVPFLTGNAFMIGPYMFVALLGQRDGNTAQYNTYKGYATQLLDGMANGTWIDHTVGGSGGKSINELYHREALRGVAWLAGTPLLGYTMVPDSGAAPTLVNATQSALTIDFTIPARAENIDVRLNGGTPSRLSLDKTITGLSSGTTYTVEWRANNSVGDGAWSPSAAFATTSPPALQWNPTGKSSRVTISPDGLTITNNLSPGTFLPGICFFTKTGAGQKVMWGVTINHIDIATGVAQASVNVNQYLGFDNFGFSFHTASGSMNKNNAYAGDYPAGAPGPVVGDTVFHVLSSDGLKLWVGTRQFGSGTVNFGTGNNPSTNTGGFTLTAGTWKPAASVSNSSQLAQLTIVNNDGTTLPTGTIWLGSATT